MAEAGGLVIGVVGLAALFNSAVECFDYIQLGRNFGKDFQTCQIKLDNARLRLSRWGASLGLNGDAQTNIVIPSRELAQAQALMGQILELFADAEAISDKFKSWARTDAADGGTTTATNSNLSLAICESATDLDPAIRDLHEKMRRLAIERQKQTGLRRKTKWVLYERRNFNRLLENITDLVNALIEMFPLSQSRQEELCQSEAAFLTGDETSPSLLRHIAAQQDKLLETAINNVISNNITTTFSAPASGGLQIGYNTGSIQTHIHQPAERPEPPPCPGSTIPFLRDRDFVVRETILNQITIKATPGFWAALVGLGGVGKSQLAIEYGYRIRDKSPETWVFWVYASNSVRFEESYREIADRAKIPGRTQSDNIPKLVFDWLCSRSGNWFIILDNADDTDFLRKESHSKGLIGYIPKGQNGSVLITTRSREAALQLVDGSDIIPVETMDETHAITLLRTKLGNTNDDNESLANLAAALEFMPLAIVQAAAYISQKAPRVSVEKYLEKFQKSDSRKTSLLSYEGGRIRRDHDAKNSILTTWQISFDHIKETRPSAADLLSYMSFFDRQGIPEFMLHNYRNNMEQNESPSEDNNGGATSSASESSEDDDFENDLQILRVYSFISIGTDPSVFEMHRLVQLATRTWLEAHGLLETWKQQFISQLCAKFPRWERNDFWPTCWVLLPHVKSVLGLEPKETASIQEWALLLMKAVTYTLLQGNATDAVVISSKVIEVCKNSLGEDHELTLAHMHMLGISYYLTGKEAKASSLIEEVVKKDKKQFGVGKYDEVIDLFKIAASYAGIGRFAEAEKVGEKALEISKKVNGIEHEATLAVMNNLARIYEGQGKWEKALELLEKAVEVEKRMQSLENPNTASCMLHLLDMYREVGRLEEAAELGEQMVEICTRVMSAESPRTLTGMYTLSRVYLHQGRLEEAETLGVKAMDGMVKIMGREYPRTRSSMDHMARIYREQGRWDESEELERQVLELRKRILGPVDLDTLNLERARQA